MREIVYPSPSDDLAITIGEKDMNCLGPGELVNDEVMDFWCTYLRVQILPELKKTLWKNTSKGPPSFKIASSFFATKSRTNDVNRGKWFKSLDIESYDFTFIPYHKGAHWKLLIVDREAVQIYLLDSLEDYHNEDIL
jgi:Ulp1 family protease